MDGLASPLWAALRWFFGSRELHGRRARALALGSSAMAACAVMAFALPLPHRTLAPGVVWLPDEALVRPDSDGFIAQLLVADGQQVQAGTPLLRLRNEPLLQSLASVQAELQQQQVEQLSAIDSDALRAAHGRRPHGRTRRRARSPVGARGRARRACRHERAAWPSTRGAS